MQHRTAYARPADDLLTCTIKGLSQRGDLAGTVGIVRPVEGFERFDRPLERGDLVDDGTLHLDVKLESLARLRFRVLSSVAFELVEVAAEAVALTLQRGLEPPHDGDTLIEFGSGEMFHGIYPAILTPFWFLP